MKRLNVAVAIVVRNGLILICQRRHEDAFGGYWEFPGGKVEVGESLEDCVRRELVEELDLLVHPIAPLTSVHHDYPGLDLTLHPFLCQCDEGEPRTIACQAARWVLPRELCQYRFPPASEPIIAGLLQRRDLGIDLAAKQV